MHKKHVPPIFKKLLIRCLCYFFVGFLTLAFAPTSGFSQITLPAAAQEAYNKGMMAAKLPDYPLAISYFQEARKLSPQSSEIYFNLGLAESKIAGRELRAISWFEAYLLANPTSPNAALIKEQMDICLVFSTR